MIKSIISPSKYVQGKGVLKKLKDYTINYGSSFFIIASENGIKRNRKTIEESFREEQVSLIFEAFKGECSKTEIKRLTEIVKRNKCNAVIGVGGGKVLDTAKAVAYYAKLPIVIVPTIASTDAPCSALSVIYTDEGVFDSYLVLDKNPDIVVVDTDIIAKAPSRLLVAGMGDALATYFEARASVKSNSSNLTGEKTTKAAIALARLCYETLLEDGLKAKLAVDKNISTKAVENIVEANTYLSGIGFESGGLAAAHAIHNGFTVMEECHHMNHGEKVAFGTIAQLVLENSCMEELTEVIEFCLDVGLPVCLEDLGVKEVKEEDIRKVAEVACAEDESIHNMPFEVVADDVYSAILVADALGKAMK